MICLPDILARGPMDTPWGVSPGKQSHRAGVGG